MTNLFGESRFIYNGGSPDLLGGLMDGGRDTNEAAKPKPQQREKMRQLKLFNKVKDVTAEYFRKLVNSDSVDSFTNPSETGQALHAKRLSMLKDFVKSNYNVPEEKLDFFAKKIYRFIAKNWNQINSKLIPKLQKEKKWEELRVKNKIPADYKMHKYDRPSKDRATQAKANKVDKFVANLVGESGAIRKGLQMIAGAASTPGAKVDWVDVRNKFNAKLKPFGIYISGKVTDTANAENIVSYNDMKTYATATKPTEYISAITSLSQEYASNVGKPHVVASK